LPEDDLEVQVAHVAVAIEADVAPLDDQALAAIILPELVEDLAARTVVRGDGGPERRQVGVVGSPDRRPAGQAAGLGGVDDRLEGEAGVPRLRHADAVAEDAAKGEAEVLGELDV